MSLLQFTILYLLFSIGAGESPSKEDVVVIEAKEVDGKPIAESRSSSPHLSNYPAVDQIAIESGTGAHAVYAPAPPGLAQAAIPMPIPIDAKPGSLVIPGLPRNGIPPNLRGFGIPPHHRRQLPVRPPPAVHKVPHPVVPNYVKPFGVPSQFQAPSNMAPPPPPSFAQTVPQNSEIQFNIPPAIPSVDSNSIDQTARDDKNFGDPKPNDVHHKRETVPDTAHSESGNHEIIFHDEVYSSDEDVLPRKPILSGNQDLNIVESTHENDFNNHAESKHLDVWPLTANDMPKIVALDVKCEKHLMKVRIEFDQPFNGIIFSKGHYSNVHCVHLPAGLGRTYSTFDISINSCGTTGNTENSLLGHGGATGSGSFFENTIVIQYDPQVQEVWDQARKLRCTWHDQYEKSVTFKPFGVDMLDVVRADFAGDNVGCWMQIQVGKGPWASEVSGLVKIGQTMTMVLAIKDDDNKFDMMVRNCMAHDGNRAPIQLVDQRGCITRPKLMSRFTKIKDFGASASVLSYAHFQAFKFPDSMEVHFQCTIQICRYQCPDPCSDDTHGYSNALSRRKRETGEETDIGVNRVIQVVSKRDLTFVFDKDNVTEEITELTKETVIASPNELDGLICMSTPGFAITLIVLLGMLIVSCLLSAFLCLKFRCNSQSSKSLISYYSNPRLF